MHAPALELLGTGRVYGAVTALQATTLTLYGATVTVVVGPNGSGKSTLLRLAAGVLRPSTGVRRCPGTGLYLRPDGGGRAVERVAEAVRFSAALTEETADPSRACDAVHDVGLGQLSDRRVGTLSSGERGRLLAAHLRAARPTVACLDEPTAHLDVAGSTAVVSAIEDVASTGTAVLVATHDPAPFAPVLDAELVLHDGRLVPAAPSPGLDPATP